MQGFGRGSTVKTIVYIKEGMTMKKWLIAGIIILFVTTAIVFGISARSTNSMGNECVEDGSCCNDENTCTCE
jgi:hypothetical protein